MLRKHHILCRLYRLRKSNGFSAVPWGTPDLTHTHLDALPATLTCYNRFANHRDIQSSTWPYFFSLHNNLDKALCQRLFWKGLPVLVGWVLLNSLRFHSCELGFLAIVFQTELEAILSCTSRPSAYLKWSDTLIVLNLWDCKRKKSGEWFYVQIASCILIISALINPTIDFGLSMISWPVVAHADYIQMQAVTVVGEHIFTQYI